ncbi:PAS domain-containing protein [Arsenicibacter rosenii]|uniref:histidine kinase n=1 Tax=Arsenicibacter rosenii TaxID=1750698 RepID=A0A1S2VS28_9BACT|nr:PAS domain-containing protein [Arsenicibacter rosenii]OIN60718.1 hypothetical protein BLX24_01000 [Arsenicibacter rosenii]
MPRDKRVSIAGKPANPEAISGKFSFQKTTAGIAVLWPAGIGSERMSDFMISDANPAFRQFLTCPPDPVSGIRLSELPAAISANLINAASNVMLDGGIQRCLIGNQVACTLTKSGEGVEVICLPAPADPAQTTGGRQLQPPPDAAPDQIWKRLRLLQILHEWLLEQHQEEMQLSGSFLNQIYALIPCNRITLLRFDPKTDTAEIDRRLLNGVLEETPEKGLSAGFFRVPPLINGDILLDNNLLHDTYKELGDWNPYARGFRSFIMVPLFRDYHYLGVFALFSTQQSFFTEAHINLLKEIAGQLSIVLLQKKIHKEIREQNQKLEIRDTAHIEEIKKLSLVQKNILELTDVGIIAFNALGEVDIANPASERMLGSVAGGLSAKKSEGIFSDFSFDITTASGESGETLSYRAILSQLIHIGHFQAKGTLQNKQGDKLPILLTATTLLDEHREKSGFVVMLSDMSRIVAVENQLHERNRLLTAFFDSTAALHCVTNKKGYFVLLNPLWEKVLGYSLSELMATPYIDFLHPDDVKKTLSAVDAFLQHKLLQNDTTFVNRYRHKNGGYRLIEWTSSLSGEVMISSARDITDQHIMHQRLKAINRRLQLATKASQQGIWEYNARKDRFIWDKRTCEIYGVSPERMTKGFSFGDFYALIHEEDKPVLLNDFVTLGETINYTRILRIPLPDGRIRFVENYGLLLTDKDGKPVKATGVVADITSRMEAEEALLESEQRFREIADNVDEAFFIFTTNPFQFLYVNAAYERLWGVNKNQFYKNPALLANAIATDDLPLVRTFYEQTMAGTEGQVEFRIKSKAHVWQWVLMRIFIKRDEQGKPLRYIGLASDITSRKEKELVLHEALVREQDLNKLKSQFVSTASHEFRTPLMTMQTCIDLIKWYVERPDASAKEAIYRQLRIMQDEIKSFSELLSDILTVGRIDAGKVTMHLADADMVNVVNGVISTHFARRNDNREVSLFVKGTPYTIPVDENLMTHVLVNLLSNAFKFSAENPELTLDFSSASQLVITVQDRGIGIPAAELPSLFQAFFRASNTAAIQGTGLGLVIARQFVELHQGVLTVDSIEKQGTTFTIRLPRKTKINLS